MASVIVLDTAHAFGYHNPSDFHSEYTNSVHFHNVCNVMSIFLSSIVGIIRIFTAFFFLYLMNNISQEDQEDFNPASELELEANRRFLRMQAVRGGEAWIQ